MTDVLVSKIPINPNKPNEPKKKRVKQSHCIQCTKVLVAGLPTLVFGLFTVIFTIQQDLAAKATREQDQKISDELARRTIFKEYIDDMEDLLLNEKYKDLDRTLLQIRIQTLTVLKVLNPDRKRDIIRFLYENRLIRHDQEPTVNLHGADLAGMRFMKSSTESCDFPYLYLPGIYGENMFFESCLLYQAVFDDSSMSGSLFNSCNMMNSSFLSTNLTRTKFRGNSIFGSNFTGAFLREASVSGGFFQRIDLTNVDLEGGNFNDSLFGFNRYQRILGNIFINSRYSNGSFSEIDRKNLIVQGTAPLKCDNASIEPWIISLTPDANDQFESDVYQRSSYEELNNRCYIRVPIKHNLIQEVHVRRYSLLIDSERASFNLSMTLGMKNFSSNDSINILLHFIEEEGSAEYSNTIVDAVTSEAFFREIYMASPIPQNARMIIVSFDCNGTSPVDQFCVFDDIRLSVYYDKTRNSSKNYIAA